MSKAGRIQVGILVAVVIVGMVGAGLPWEHDALPVLRVLVVTLVITLGVLEVVKDRSYKCR